MIQRTFFATLLLTGLFYVFGGASADRVLAEVDPSAPSVSAASREALDVDGQPAVVVDGDERAALAFLQSRHTGMARHDERNVARAVVREARRNDFDPALILAVIQVESGGFNLAVSHVGAMGLMQLLPSTAEELAGKLGLEWRGSDSLFDPVLNVRLGTAYLKLLADRYDDVSTALAAYNWGPGRIDRRIAQGAGLPSIYTDRVMKALDVAEARRDAQPTRS